jgi:D-alanyl-D-alanine endopeptidase (penicillin-binding protein 7)
MQKLLIAFFLSCIATITVAANTKTSIKASSPNLMSAHVMVVDARTGALLYSKNATIATPIASVTKLMTAMVVLDAKLSLNQKISVTNEDVDQLKNTRSRIPVGTTFTRQEMLQLALMSSENRAAACLSRNYPGGRSAFIKAMNNKATALGMTSTRFIDPTGLSPSNVSTAKDLVKMVKAASTYPLIHQITTTAQKNIKISSQRAPLLFKNTNSLVRGGKWSIDVSKTGYINEAGHCLVMMVNIKNKPMVIVLLDAPGKYTTAGDASRIKEWLERSSYAGTLTPQVAEN